jgi:hypothetical protein
MLYLRNTVFLQNVFFYLIKVVKFIAYFGAKMEKSHLFCCQICCTFVAITQKNTKNRGYLASIFFNLSHTFVLHTWC